MSNPWQPEREVTLEEARRYIWECGLAATDVRVLASGWDNTVVLADDAWVFRFPRREIALPGIDREIALLPRLAPHLRLAIPLPEHVGVYGRPPWRFWGGRHLAGTELAVSSHADRESIAGDVGAFLADLHGLTPDPMLPVDPFGRADAVLRAARSRDVLDDLTALGLYDPADEIGRLLAEASAADRPPKSVVLSHGDLYSRHVLVDEAGHASGVIDWGDLCAAPASVDLSIAFSAFAGAERAAFFAAYGDIDADTELRARVMAIFSAASVAHYAHDTDDPVLLAAALDELANAAR